MNWREAEHANEFIIPGPGFEVITGWHPEPSKTRVASC